MSNYDEFGNPAGAGEFDPAYGSGEFDPTSDAAALEQAGEIGAARGAAQMMAYVQSQQQQAAAFEQTKYAAEQTVAAEKILSEIDPTYQTQKAQVVRETLAQHPTLLREGSVGNPEELAADFARAWELGSKIRTDAAAEAKQADDDAAVDRIKAAADLNYSGFRARGVSVHDLLKGE